MLATLDYARKAGFSPVAIAPAAGPLADALAERDVELLPFDCRVPDGTRLPQARLRENLAAILTRRRPNLLHANSLAMGRLSGPVAVALGLPSLSHLRDILRLGPQAVADLNGHTRLLAVSNATREFHIAGGIDPGKTHVLYNGVDLHAFRPGPPTGYLHRELGLPPETQLVGTIGQIGLRKGQDILLRVAERLADSLPNVHYLLIGERHSQKDESHAFEKGLRACGHLPVHFLGVRNDVSQLLRELILLVHPARQEPLGRVLLEAAASATPVIATDVGGTREIFPPDSLSARLTPVDNAESLGDAILQLVQEPALRKYMAERARKRAEEQFDIRTSAANLTRHYGEV